MGFDVTSRSSSSLSVSLVKALLMSLETGDEGTNSPEQHFDRNGREDEAREALDGDHGLLAEDDADLLRENQDHGHDAHRHRDGRGPHADARRIARGHEHHG